MTATSNRTRASGPESNQGRARSSTRDVFPGPARPKRSRAARTQESPLPRPAPVFQFRPMIGTILNTGAILAGGIIGLTVTRDFSPAAQSRLKALLGAFIVYAGLSTTWGALNGGFGRVIAQLGIVMLALVLGNATGKLLRLQRGLNALGKSARDRFAAARPGDSSRPAEGFITCTLLFCVGPMAILGAMQDGLTGNFRTLAIKSVLDGLATMAFVRTFGWGVMLAALPVLAYQGTLTLLAGGIQPLLERQQVLDAINATGGLLVTCIALVVLDVKKVPLADYLPSLLWAPLLAHWIL